jgi:hypothetical protein
MIAMVGTLRKRLGVVAIVTATIYFRDGTIFQDFVNGYFKLPDRIFLEIRRQILITKTSWIRLLATFSRLKDLNRILDLFKRLKVIKKPTRFDK